MGLVGKFTTFMMPHSLVTRLGLIFRNEVVCHPSVWQHTNGLAIDSRMHMSEPFLCGYRQGLLSAPRYWREPMLSWGSFWWWYGMALELYGKGINRLLPWTIVYPTWAVIYEAWATRRGYIFLSIWFTLPALATMRVFLPLVFMIVAFVLPDLFPTFSLIRPLVLGLG